MTVSQQIIEVINALCEKFGIAIDWTSQNVIPYLEALCEKLIVFEITTSIFWMCVPLLLLAIFVPITLTTHKKASKLQYPYDDDEPITWIAIASTMLALATLIWALVGIPMQIYDIIEATVFPEKTIFDYITNIKQ